MVSSERMKFAPTAGVGLSDRDLHTRKQGARLVRQRPRNLSGRYGLGSKPDAARDQNQKYGYYTAKPVSFRRYPPGPMISVTPT